MSIYYGEGNEQWLRKKFFKLVMPYQKVLEETIAAAHNYSGELRVEVIPIKKIEIDPENPRDLISDF